VSEQVSEEVFTRRWDFGEDENDAIARIFGVDPCDLDNWRYPLLFSLLPFELSTVGEA
jgi:hypothetical protein